MIKVEDHWVQNVMIFKDVLKTGKGTEFNVESIEFDANIPENIFSKASLRK